LVEKVLNFCFLAKIGQFTRLSWVSC